MLICFSQTSQRYVPIRSTLQSLAAFSVCVLIHHSRRVTSDLSSSKPPLLCVHLSTFQPCLKPPGTTHSAEKELSYSKLLPRRQHVDSKDPTLAPKKMGYFRRIILRETPSMNTLSAEKETHSLRSIARLQPDESKDPTLAPKKTGYFVYFQKVPFPEIPSMNTHSAETTTLQIENSIRIIRVLTKPSALAKNNIRNGKFEGCIEKIQDTIHCSELAVANSALVENSLSSSNLPNSIPIRWVYYPDFFRRTTSVLNKNVEVGNCIEKTQDMIHCSEVTVANPSALVGNNLSSSNLPNSVWIRKVCAFKHCSKRREEKFMSKPNINSNKVLSQEPSFPKNPILNSPILLDDTSFPGKYGEKKPSPRMRRSIFPRRRLRLRIVPKRWRSVYFKSSHFHDVDRPRASHDSFLLTWTMTYAMMVWRKWSPERKKTPNPKWAGLITPHMDDKAILQAWSKIPVELLHETWRDFMFWALEHSPGRALKVLEVAISDGTPKIPRYVLQDCIDYLAAFYLKELIPLDSEKLDRILRLTCKFIHDYGFSEGRTPLLVNSRTPYLVLTCCRDDQAKNFWDFLVQHNVYLRSWTLLHFLAKFTEMADLSRSMEVLRKVIQTGIELASLDVQYGCAKLLRGHFDKENLFNARMYIWTQLLRMGIPPSIYTYNAMIGNCVEAGEYASTITLYHQARENQIQPDFLTYLYLLEVFKRGCSLDVLDLVIHDAEADGTLPNRYLICMILSTSIRHDFAKILQLYGRYYNLNPLIDIGVIHPSELLCESTTSSRYYPPPQAVGHMLTAYIKQDPASDEVIGLYERYRALVREQNFYAIATTQTDHVSNAFIHAFGQRPETVELCTAVIGDMLRPAIGHFSVKINAAQPTIISWTLLLQAACRHGQMLAAEKIMSMMCEREVVPNRYTWNILVFGHAVAQDIDGAMGAVKRMEAAGFPIEADIVRALGMYRNRTKLLQALGDIAEADKQEELYAQLEAPHPVCSVFDPGLG